MLKNFFRKVVRAIPVYRELLQMRDALRTLNHQLSQLQSIQLQQWLDRELDQHPRYRDPLRLPRYAARVNSQNGEDGILGEIFRRIGVTNRVFAEVGIGNGVENNTAFLLAQGWSGYWIDGDDAFVGQLAAHPEMRDRVTSLVSFVNRENIAQLFAQMNVPRDFDLLSLDIDQNTYHIWEPLREYSPRVVVVEYNSNLPAEVDWKVRYAADRVWDGTMNFGASLKAFERLGERLGYHLVGCDLSGSNAFFVRQDLVGDRFAAPFTAENHYEPMRLAFIQRFSHRPTLLDRQTPIAE